MAGFTSEYVKTTAEEAREVADAIYEVKGYSGRTIFFVRAVEEDGEWALEALESTLSGRMATIPGFPSPVRDTKEEAVENISAVMKRKYQVIRRVK